MSVTRDEHSGEADDDSSFLDQVLNKLYDFGDGKNKRLKKSRKRKNSAKDDMNDTEENTDTVCHNTDSEQLVTNTTVCENMQSGAEQSSVEVVTFIDPLKKNKLSKPVEPRQKARFEVHKFGLTGYHKQQQRVFEQDRAVMLGARPPKKEYVNYKAYQEIIKEQKIKAKEEAKSEPHKKKRKDGKSRFEKRKSSSGGDIGGQVGRFKDGMLVLSSKDIQKLKVKVRK
ncbi:putative protein C1orf131-like [Labeo rohita]|uniref:Uncharacterized protein n=2 Tax=Labeo rohita TaxID=84645 RepID=A0ABQ8LM68_LABRO|nr:hypothetical protein H4Q32_014486 [Labeo rohita]RXN30749.1 putative protein C1orf131-like [Labeo rohita]